MSLLTVTHLPLLLRLLIEVLCVGWLVTLFGVIMISNPGSLLAKRVSHTRKEKVVDFARRLKESLDGAPQLALGLALFVVMMFGIWFIWSMVVALYHLVLFLA
jgi:hypothetical protein